MEATNAAPHIVARDQTLYLISNLIQGRLEVILSLKSEGRIVSLIYLLGNVVEESPPPKVWPFSNLRTHWLYDKIDLVDPRKHRLYQHRILLSDGRVISIAFYDVVVHLFSEQDPEPAIISRRRA
jgi:hypothetical protein